MLCAIVLEESLTISLYCWETEEKSSAAVVSLQESIANVMQTEVWTTPVTLKHASAIAKYVTNIHD